MTPPTPPRLTLERIDARVLSAPRRPIVGKVGEYRHWPFVLVDVVTREGITGHGYLEPLPRVLRPPAARERERRLARMAGLGQPVPDGAVQIPDRPGAGSAWDEAAVKKFSA